MKLGFIFECGPDGGDMKVFRHLSKMILAGVNIPFEEKKHFDYEPLSSKPGLLKESGKAAKRLLGAGCEKVFIVWDLFPAWRDDREKPCRHEDKEAIKASLAAHQISPEQVIFLCLEEELEAWLIADGRALNAYFSKPHRKIDEITDNKNPDKAKDPKGILTGYFKRFKGGIKYDGNTHAEQIAKQLPDFKRIRRSETFRRFYLKLTGNSLK
jgi:hypothetical protein